MSRAGDAAEAVAAARAAQPAWAARPLAERIACLDRFRQLVAGDVERLATLLTADMGKPVTQARNEVGAVGDRLAYVATEAPSVLEPETVLDDPEAGLREVLAWEPLGVVANISAWNYPWFVGANVWAPALACGNAVAYKPSEHVPCTGEAIAELWHEAGVPEDVFVLVPGGPEAGAALVDADVDMVCFTGSYATGRRIAEAVAGRMVRLQLELGGKDPVYVAGDVDVDAAAASLADGAFYNTGQSCCSVERIYVERTIHDDFVEAFVRAVEDFVVGDPADEATYIGPLTRAEQLDVLVAQVADAVARGATVRVGGGPVEAPPGPGAWFAPTVLTGVDHTMAVMRDESFGPVIGIQAVDGDDEAVAAMNDTDYGLTAGVYTADEARARRILARVDAGSAYWNCCDRVSPRLPWTGRHHSGLGATLGRPGIEAFVRPKAWHLRQA